MSEQLVRYMELAYKDGSVSTYLPTWWCEFRDMLLATRGDFLPWKDENTPGWKEHCASREDV